MKLPHAFVQLPISFDATRLATEVAAIEEASWMDHPQKFPGNSMLPLIAVDGDPANESFAGKMRQTPHLERCPYLQQTMAALGVTLGRSRLMRLAGGAEVSPHADQGYYWIDRVRIHVPIVTQPTVMFHCGGAVVNMRAGECWIFDTWREHRVVNENDDQRIHLVVDTVGGSAFWKHINKGRPHPAERERSDWAATLIEYEPGAQPELPLETANVPPVMTPWEIESHLGFLLRETPQTPHMPAIVGQVGQFTREWRALWAQHGTDQAGHAAYRQCLNDFLAHLKPTASAVFLKNGVNLFGAVQAMIGMVAVIPDERSDVIAMADRA